MLSSYFEKDIFKFYQLILIGALVRKVLFLPKNKKWKEKEKQRPEPFYNIVYKQDLLVTKLKKLPELQKLNLSWFSLQIIKESYHQTFILLKNDLYIQYIFLYL